MTIEERFGLAGRVALVTGARQGIGEAIAQALAEAGARSRSRAARPLADAGALALELDVGDEAQVDAAVAATVAELGGLDIVVNNAALTATSPRSS